MKNIILEIADFGLLYPNWKIETLEYGDIYLENNGNTVLIERKQYMDYINSIGNDLKTRLFKMRQIADYTVLLIEDAPTNISDEVKYYYGHENNVKSIKSNVYNNFMFSQGINGTIIFPTINLKHTIIAVLNIYNYLGKLDKRKGAKPSSTLELLEMFPGVGRKKAHLLSKKYKNMADAMDNWREWLNEKGQFEFYGSW